MKHKILVVDDERSIREFFDILLRKEGYEVACAENGKEAVHLLNEQDFDLVISDVVMDGVSGIEVLRHAKSKDTDTVVIMITAYASAETAIEAMKEGAFDYISKPFRVEEIKVIISKALEAADLRRENRRLKSEIRDRRGIGTLIGDSEPMRRVHDMIKKVSASKVNVLITGESGTGKELVAKAIHYHSNRAGGEFVSMNCGAVPENLMESELFGHVRGAFTGAVDNKIGLFELADGGTFFLDEIGEIPTNLQVKLLRVLQERSFRKVGGTKDIKVDVRIIAASNRDLEEDVKNGNFRQDLFYRLNVVRLNLPPLRERKEDIPLLVNHFVKKYGEEFNKPSVTIDDKAVKKLMSYHYPGNVRELENIIEGAVALAQGDVISEESLHIPTLEDNMTSINTELIPESGVDLEGILYSIERRYLKRALEITGGKKKDAAKLLGMTFRSFRYRLQKHGLQQEQPDN